MAGSVASFVEPAVPTNVHAVRDAIRFQAKSLDAQHVIGGLPDAAKHCVTGVINCFAFDKAPSCLIGKVLHFGYPVAPPIFAGKCEYIGAAPLRAFIIRLFFSRLTEPLSQPCDVIVAFTIYY